MEIVSQSPACLFMKCFHRPRSIVTKLPCLIFSVGSNYWLAHHDRGAPVERARLHGPRVSSEVDETWANKQDAGTFRAAIGKRVCQLHLR